MTLNDTWKKVRRDGQVVVGETAHVTEPAVITAGETSLAAASPAMPGMVGGASINASPAINSVAANSIPAVNSVPLEVSGVEPLGSNSGVVGNGMSAHSQNTIPQIATNSVAAGGYRQVSTTTQPVIGTVPANQSAINAVQQGGGPSSSKTIKFANIAFAPLVLIWLAMI